MSKVHRCAFFGAESPEKPRNLLLMAFEPQATHLYLLIVNSVMLSALFSLWLTLLSYYLHTHTYCGILNNIFLMLNGEVGVVEGQFLAVQLQG